MNGNVFAAKAIVELSAEGDLSAFGEGVVLDPIIGLGIWLEPGDVEPFTVHATRGDKDDPCKTFLSALLQRGKKLGGEQIGSREVGCGDDFQSLRAFCVCIQHVTRIVHQHMNGFLNAGAELLNRLEVGHVCDQDENVFVLGGFNEFLLGFAGSVDVATDHVDFGILTGQGFGGGKTNA